MEFTGEDMLETHMRGIRVGVDRGFEQGRMEAMSDAAQYAKKIKKRNLVFLAFAGVSGLIFSFIMWGIVLDLQKENYRFAKLNSAWMIERAVLDNENRELTRQLIKATWGEGVDAGALQREVCMPNSSVRLTEDGGVCIDSEVSLKPGLQSRRVGSFYDAGRGDSLDQWLRL